MRRVTWLGLGLALAASFAMAATPAASSARAGDAASADAKVATGQYLLRIGNCEACHTRRGGAAWTGGRAVPTPFGTIYSTNLTPDPQTGIGAWSADDFWHALHEGRSRDGRRLYPAFPYDFFTRIRREDSDAMFAALQTQPPVRAEPKPPELAFPFNQRWLLAPWRLLHFTPGELAPRLDKSAAWNRGAYLVEAVAHCGACHTPRNRLGAVRTAEALAGTLIPVQDWDAPDLRGGEGGGLAAWQPAELRDFLRRGTSPHGNAFGPMAEVVSRSLQYLSDADAEAISTYLLDQPPVASGTDWERLQPPAIREAARQPSWRVEPGRRLYEEHCADCHGRDGAGEGPYPSLTASSSVRGSAINTTRMVLLGGFGASTRSEPRPWSMPPFAPQLDDEEIAAVVSYIRYTFGDGARAVTPEMVARYRSTPLR